MIEKREGGGGDKVDSDGSILVNRMMIFDHSLMGFDFNIYPGFKKESSLSLT